MNTKTFISGLAGGIVLFLAGYLVYGVILMDYFVSNTISYPGLFKEPMEIWAIGVGNILWGILLAYIFNMAGILTASAGALKGAIILFLFALGVNFVFYAQMNLYNMSACFVDSIAMAILGGLSGAVIAWLLGRNTGKAA